MSAVWSCSGFSNNLLQEGCGGVNVVRQIAIITAFAVRAKPQLAKEFGFPHRKAKVSRMSKLMRHDKDGPRIWQLTLVAR